jgi:ketosteroid isomerase-like protein
MTDQVPECIRASYVALSGRDLDAWSELFTEDAGLHEVAEVPDASVYRGRARIREWAEAGLAISRDWSWRLEEMLAADQDTYVTRAHLEVHGRESGVLIDEHVFHVWEERDGKIASVRGFLRREDALASAGL